ncbi:MAG: peptide deformylase [Bacteroidetes bacterium]|nr:peptide deformylase [Bacteroidota bacterium]
MILPITIYGNSILRKSCIDLTKETPGLEALIENLWNTLYSSGGVGLAAPQINSEKRIFIIDSSLLYNELTDSQKEALFQGDKGIKETFINARIITESKEKWSELEGCLSIPGIVEPVDRAWSITVEYHDKSFMRLRKRFSGYTAKVIQHEYDHTNGVLFIDHFTNLKKKLLKNKLEQIKKGDIVNK